MITRDNVVVTVNATILTQIVDAKQALFSVANFGIAIDVLGLHQVAFGHRHALAR